MRELPAGQSQTRNPHPHPWFGPREPSPSGFPHWAQSLAPELPSYLGKGEERARGVGITGVQGSPTTGWSSRARLSHPGNAGVGRVDKPHSRSETVS